MEPLEQDGESALAIPDIVRRDFGISLPDPPVLSLDFLAQYLTLGSVRFRVPKASVRSLPLVLEPRLMRFLTPELIRESSRIREEMKDVPENVIRRRVEIISTQPANVWARSLIEERKCFLTKSDHNESFYWGSLSP